MAANKYNFRKLLRFKEINLFDKNQKFKMKLSSFFFKNFPINFEENQIKLINIYLF